MVSVVQLHPQSGAAALAPIAEGLAPAERALVGRALELAEPLYAGQALSTGEPTWGHALGLAASLAAVGLDAPGRAAGLLFAAPKYLDGIDKLRESFGEEIAALAGGVEKLYQLRLATRGSPAEQNEVLRKMVLGMAEDVRVVLIRLASRTQTLRWFAKNASDERVAYARETLDIYAPLANRLGLWQLKWELEDLSFRYLEPDLYKRIAKMLDERRLERERYIAAAMDTLRGELAALDIKAQITGRPKHIYSIWNKMRTKSLDFSEVYDVRALRVIVPEVKDCYAALGVVHNLWQPVPKEFDDYISRPKGNLYQSLHTAVLGPGDKTLEVQIRTEEMHRQAEYGVAAHWQYKEKAKASKAFEQKVAWLRQLLAWRDEVPVKKPQDEVIYVLTPQGRVIDLPAGSTPIDFAYALHSDLGHRCRGSRVDGHIVKLDRPLASGQRVEIVAAKTGGPSRDWLNPERGFARSARARHKIRQWFNAKALADTIAAGRATVEKMLRREGAMHASLEGLAGKMGFAKPEEMFAAVARDEVNLRQLQVALKGVEPAPGQPVKTRRSGGSSQGNVFVVGMGGLATQLARCCKPVPPDPIRGFVTRGKGISIHREDCMSLKRLAEGQPERLMDTEWGGKGDAAYAVDMMVTATDRRGLLRDIGDALAREKINVTAVRTQTRDELAFMRFTFDVTNVAHLKRALALVRTLKGVIRVARA